MQSLSVSEIQRNLQNLNDFDVIEIRDKKHTTHRKNLLGLIGSVSSKAPGLRVQQLRADHLKKYE